MSNHREKFVKHQISLFEMIQKEQQFPDNNKSGSLNFSQEYSMVLSRCFSNSRLDVVVFANKMTGLLNRGLPDDPVITPDKVRSWTSIAKVKYGPKAWFMPAFCTVANSCEPIDFLVRKIHRYMMPGPEALRSEIQEIDEQIEELKKEKEERILFLKLKNKK